MEQHPQTSQPPIKTRLLIHLAAFLLNLCFSTCRINIVGGHLHRRFITGPSKVIGATWHRGAIFLVWFFRKARPMIMFSRSKDGDLLAGFAEKLGVIPARGSSSRGGRQALKQMLNHLHQQGPQKVATVLDGPRGPRFVAKKGMLVLSMISGVPLLPIMVSAHPAVTFKKSWDQTFLPLPFSRVTVWYAPALTIEPTLTAAGMEIKRLEVQRILNTMMAQADRQTGYQRPKIG